MSIVSTAFGRPEGVSCARHADESGLQRHPFSEERRAIEALTL